MYVCAYGACRARSAVRRVNGVDVDGVDGELALKRAPPARRCNPLSWCLLQAPRVSDQPCSSRLSCEPDRLHLAQVGLERVACGRRSCGPVAAAGEHK